MTATLTPDRPVRRVTELIAPRPKVQQVRVDASPRSTPIPHPGASALVNAWRTHFAPLRARIRSRGLARAAPASLALAATSLTLTALVQVPSPAQQDATAMLAYRGDDLYTGQLWRLLTSGLLAQSWAQWAWTLFVAITVFAVLEVQVGPARLLACVAASHILPTVAVALLAPPLGHAELLGQIDYGTSCLVIGAAAALTWVRRSMLLAAIIAAGMTADVVLSAPLTAIEHAAALLVGALVVAGAHCGRKHVGHSRAGSVT
jgi:membrane associated rhomboid family serine protease